MVDDALFWVDSRAIGMLAHAVRGMCEPGVTKVYRGVCGVVRSGEGQPSVPPDRQCPRCVDELARGRRQ